MDLAQLRNKYPKDIMILMFEPIPDCRYCHGTGEARTKHPKYPVRPCICVSVDHSVAEMFQDTINSVCAKERNGKSVQD